MLTLRLSALVFAAGLVVWAIAPQRMAWLALAFPIALRVAGLVLALVALALQSWMFVSLGDNITDTVAVRPNATLVTHGPYRWIRHPLYTFGTLFLIGISLATANGFLFMAGAIAMRLVARRTPIEEAQLIARFGDAYRDYMRNTGRYWPRLGTRQAGR